MSFAGMSYVMSLTSSLTYSHSHMHTHSTRGFPAVHTPIHIPFLFKDTSLLQLKVKAICFRSHLCIVLSLTCSSQWNGWRARQFIASVRILLPWKCPVWLDITFSAHFPRNQASASNWLWAPGESPPKVPLTSTAHTLIQTISLCAAVTHFWFLSDARCTPSFSYWVLSPSSVSDFEYDSVSPPLCPPLLKIVVNSLSKT